MANDGKDETENLLQLHKQKGEIIARLTQIGNTDPDLNTRLFEVMCKITKMVNAAAQVGKPEASNNEVAKNEPNQSDKTTESAGKPEPYVKQIRN